jgi:Domain of unknown function (DUF1707)
VATPGTPEPAPVEIRASDAERGAVVQQLQVALAEGRITVDEFTERSAAAQAARTHADLAPLTRDLPVPGRAHHVPGPPAARPGPAVDRPDSAVPVVAVFGGARRKGRWVPARSERAAAVFGGVELDYRGAALGSETLELRALALFGGVDVTVPDDVHVELTGFALFGGRDVGGGVGVAAGPGSPVLRVHALALFGGVTVKARPRR